MMKAKRYLPALLALLCLSCAGTPAIKAELRRGSVKAAYLYEFFPQWREVYPGISIVAGEIKRPLLKFWALRVDLREESLEIVMTPPELNETAAGLGGDSGGSLPPGKIYSTKVSSFARANNCLSAINAGPFHPVSAKEGEERDVIGLLVAASRVISGPDSSLDALIFYQNGKAAILPQAAAGDLRMIENAAGGFRIVLRESRVEQAVFKRKARHPRSAVGLSADGRSLYLLAIDGRWFDTVGATEAETGLLLRSLGAYDGLNLDGGGSTALALLSEGKIVILNRPIHKQIPGKERAVASCIGIRAKALALP